MLKFKTRRTTPAILLACVCGFMAGAMPADAGEGCCPLNPGPAADTEAVGDTQAEATGETEAETEGEEGTRARSTPEPDADGSGEPGA